MYPNQGRYRNYNLKCQQKKKNFEGGSEEFYLLQLVNFQGKRLYFSFSMDSFEFFSPRVV